MLPTLRRIVLAAAASPSPAPAGAQAGVALRSTSGYVTDGSTDTYSLAADTWQTTRSASGGDSATFGWASGTPTAGNDSTTVDVRLAGWVGIINSGTGVFRLACTAGQAYTLTAAFGRANANWKVQSCGIYQSDGTTLIQALGSGTTQVSNTYYDATNVLRTSDTDWATNNAGLSFTATGAYIEFHMGNSTGSYYSPIAYVKLT